MRNRASNILAVGLLTAALAVGVVRAGLDTPAGVVAAPAAAISTAVLGRGTSAIAPDRALILQRRTFAPGSDSGAHPAPGPTVLTVDSGTVDFGVVEGSALLTPAGSTDVETIPAGSHTPLRYGDSVFYDQGVVHDVANPGAGPAVTLEARLNPRDPMAAAPRS